jgi:arylsulfatase A-like enzyme
MFWQWLDSTLPEMLKARGYATAAFLTNMSSAPHRGFDHKVLAVDPGRPQWQNDAEATRAACAWLTAPERQAPFFAWLHLVDPHRPYHPPEPFDRSFTVGDAPAGPVLDAELDRITVEQRSLGRNELAPILGAYDGQIASTDRFLGEVMAALEASGRAADTLVVLCSDHGEELYDHHQYFYHSPSLYDGVLRIALVLRHPGSLPRGVRVATQVQEIDVLPTVLELLDLPRSPRVEGRSLLALARGAAEADRLAYFEYARGTESKILAIRDGRWKYIHNPEGFTPRDPPYSWKGAQGFHYELGELYDLHADPREQTELAAEHPEQVQRLRAALEAWHAEKRARQGQSGAMDDQTFETLRQLGYFNAEDRDR